MATVEEHYRTLLGGVYSWMFGGFESGVNKFVEFFDEMSIRPKGNGIAIDLGAGCGFQAIPLARLGFTVTAIDLDATLLEELKDNSENHPINVVQGDIVEFDKLNIQDVELIVCMTDTLIHLESTDMVCSLFDKAQSALQIGGKFVITFRDLTHELSNLDRFIHVKGDSERILKILVVDPFGVWLAARRLHQGQFIWSTLRNGSAMALEPAQLQALVVGLPWQYAGKDNAISVL